MIEAILTYVLHRGRQYDLLERCTFIKYASLDGGKCRWQVHIFKAPTPGKGIELECFHTLGYLYSHKGRVTGISNRWDYNG